MRKEEKGKRRKEEKLHRLFFSAPRLLYSDPYIIL